MNQSELINLTADISGLSRKDVEHALKTVGDVAKNVLADDGEIVLPGIGKLVTQRKVARTVRNPMTGSEHLCAARQVVKFRVAKVLKDAVA